MEQLIDIHSHILPGLDDGAGSMEETLEMLLQAEKEGIGIIIATPHYKPMGRSAGKEKTLEVLEEVREAVRKAGLSVRLEAGNELYYSSETLEALKAGKVLTLAGSSYVLTEFSPEEDFDYIRNGIYSLLTGGYRPIVAHAERYRHVFTGKGRAEELVKMGAYLQVNTAGVTGRSGRHEKVRSRELLKQGLVQFVATDAHDRKNRIPLMKECALLIGKKYGQPYREELFFHNPQSIFTDEYLQ